MRSEVLQTLRRVNDSFYQTFGEQFADTRQRLQPGVMRALASVPAQSNMLDLGCGNAELARYLFEQGHTGRYLGVDSSAILLARAAAAISHDRASFLHFDLNQPDWSTHVAREFAGQAGFDRILCFAVLHHIPGKDARIGLLNAVHRLLAAEGEVHLSVWDFLSSERLRDRIVPWEELELTAGEVDAGDYLLDWRRGGSGLRYVHHFTKDELAELAEENSFEVIETYHSDGENGRLGFYQVWQAARSS